jgi:succinate dehydrogenase flavin-adding protein (antitoxin of CptAB toxin-antitoxin module)
MLTEEQLATFQAIFAGKTDEEILKLVIKVKKSVDEWYEAG